MTEEKSYIWPVGVSRVEDAPRAIMVSFTERLTDEEMRIFHDFIRNWTP